MIKQTKISNKLAVFSKWSRKNYAIFASLTKVVKIARLSIDICDLSLKKALSTVFLNKQEVNDESEYDDAFEIETSIQESLVFLVFQPTSTLEISFDINTFKYFNQSLCCIS